MLRAIARVTTVTGGGGGIAEAPADGQLYGRNGLATAWGTVLPLGGGTMLGPIVLAANAAANLQAVPLQQLNSAVAGLSATYQPLDADLTAIAALLGIGYAFRTGSSTWAINTTVPWTDISGAPAIPIINTVTTPLMDGAAAIGTLTTYARPDHVHPTDTTRAPLNSPAFTGTPSLPAGTVAVTPAAGDADTSIATTAFVAATVPGTNFADNAGFAIIQRAYVSGTALGAAAFGHDRWKGGAGGCTYTFAATAGPANSITITAGTLQQVIEGAALLGGNYMLSWTGTAQGRVGAGSYAASPVSVAGIVAGANTTIEFNAGTLGRVKFEGGTVATPWTALFPQQDLAKCQRFYQVIGAAYQDYGAASGTFQTVFTLSVPMRSAGAVTPTWTTTTNCSAPGSQVFGTYSNMFMVFATITALGAFNLQGTLNVSADL